MRILVYGAGPLGCIFAAGLQAGGHEVSLLARGRRLEELKRNGVVLIDHKTGVTSLYQVPLVEKLSPDDVFDLALVIMRKNKVAEVLPILSANRHIQTVLFLMNNAAGPQSLIEALGTERVMIGFPISAGYFEGNAIRCLRGTTENPVTFPIGEVDGQITPRAEAVASMLRQMPGYEVEIRKDMDAWLKTHVALLFPSMAPAFYAAGSDRERLVTTRDLLVLAVRAVREGFQVLRTLGIPITPRRLRQFEWLPEPVLVAFLQRLLARDEMEVAFAGHARAARDEVQHLVNEFLELRDRSNVTTPSIDKLNGYLHADIEKEVQPGSSSIPMDWSGVWVGVTALATVLGGTFLVRGLLVRRRKSKNSEIGGTE